MPFEPFTVQFLTTENTATTNVQYQINEVSSVRIPSFNTAQTYFCHFLTTSQWLLWVLPVNSTMSLESIPKGQ